MVKPGSTDYWLQQFPVRILLGFLLLFLPLQPEAQADVADAPVSLSISYECEQAMPLQVLLGRAQWHLGTNSLPALAAGVSFPSKAESGRALCNMQLALPADIAMHSRQSGLTLDLPSLASLVADPYPFAGLATFYTSVTRFHLRDDGSIENASAEPGLLESEEWWGWKGRYRIAVLSAPGAVALESTGKVELRWTADTIVSLAIYLGIPSVVDAPGAMPTSGFDEVRYSHLWAWLGGLSRLVERVLAGLNAGLGIGWGMTILVFAMLVKLLLLPISILTLSLQHNVSRYQSQLAPQLTRIKADYDGEEAHQRIMAAHRDLGITPFYTLKPLFASLIQIPVLVAVFNALGEMPQLDGAAFLWIANLAYPDAIAPLHFTLPMFGDSLNLLPFVMTVVTLLATLSFRNPHASIQELRRQKRNLYVMSTVFFVLFYPFPAAMVWYWTVANALQLLQQRLVRIG